MPKLAGTAEGTHLHLSAASGVIAASAFPVTSLF